MLHASDFFDLSTSKHTALFADSRYVWDVIPKIEAYIQSLLASEYPPNVEGRVFPEGVIIKGKDIHIGEGTFIEEGAFIQGPTVIGKNCEIRQGAYVRSNTVLGDGAIVGHTSEVKNSVMLENAHAPHFSYIGDSILGQNVNLGAGTKLSNLPVNSFKDKQTNKRPTIRLKIDSVIYDTELTKFGAILGDDVQTGCNSVLNPGCVIGARTLIYPLISLAKGYYPSDSIIKLRQVVEIVERN